MVIRNNYVNTCLPQGFYLFMVDDTAISGTVTIINGGTFTNTGPIPPKAEAETTYTVTWAVTNPLNNLTDVRVSAILPSYGIKLKH